MRVESKSKFSYDRSVGEEDGKEGSRRGDEFRSVSVPFYRGMGILTSRDVRTGSGRPSRRRVPTFAVSRYDDSWV